MLLLLHAGRARTLHARSRCTAAAPARLLIELPGADARTPCRTPRQGPACPRQQWRVGWSDGDMAPGKAVGMLWEAIGVPNPSAGA